MFQSGWTISHSMENFEQLLWYYVWFKTITWWMGQAHLQVGQRKEVSGGLGEARGVARGGRGAGGEKQSCERHARTLVESHCRIAQGKREEEDPRRIPALWARAGWWTVFLFVLQDGLGQKWMWGGGEGVKFIVLNLMCLSEFWVETRWVVG